LLVYNELRDGQHVDVGLWIAHGAIRVFASGQATVWAYDGVRVWSSGQAMVYLSGASRLLFGDSSRAQIKERSRAVAFDTSACRSSGGQHIELYGHSYVWAVPDHVVRLRMYGRTQADLRGNFLGRALFFDRASGMIDRASTAARFLDPG